MEWALAVLTVFSTSKKIARPRRKNLEISSHPPQQNYTNGTYIALDLKMHQASIFGKAQKIKAIFDNLIYNIILFNQRANYNT